MKFDRAQAESDAKSASDVTATKLAQGRCPYGFDRLQESGGALAGGASAAKPAQGRCPYGFDRLQEGTGAPAGDANAAKPAQGRCPYGFDRLQEGSSAPTGDAKAEKPAQGRCPYGFDRLQKSSSGAPASDASAEKPAQGRCPYGFDRLQKSSSGAAAGGAKAEKPAEGRCPYGFDRLQKSSTGDAKADKPAEGRCPYGFDRLPEVGGASAGAASTAKLAEGRCPYGFDRLPAGEETGKQKSSVNVAKAGDICFSKVAEITSPTEFADFLGRALKDRGSPEMKELYIFLQDCFTSADRDLDGFIGPKEFDALVEEATVAPRTFGYAPSADQLYTSEAERVAARAEVFKAIDAQGRGKIAFPEFLTWALEHIQAKVSHHGAQQWQSGVGMLSLLQPQSPEDFIQFLRAATSSKSCQEYKDLYFHLLRCFTDADTAMTGVIDADGFDRLIDVAAMAPRKYGFAPSTASMFKSEAERKASRVAMFKTIDKDDSGTISFHEFLDWAIDHIKGKVQGDVRAVYTPTPAKADAFLGAKSSPTHGDASSSKGAAAARSHGGSARSGRTWGELMGGICGKLCSPSKCR